MMATLAARATVGMTAPQPQPSQSCASHSATAVAITGSDVMADTYADCSEASIDMLLPWTRTDEEAALDSIATVMMVDGLARGHVQARDPVGSPLAALHARFVYFLRCKHSDARDANTRTMQGKTFYASVKGKYELYWLPHYGDCSWCCLFIFFKP
jgi:hypothetical protein